MILLFTIFENFNCNNKKKNWWQWRETWRSGTRRGRRTSRRWHWDRTRTGQCITASKGIKTRCTSTLRASVFRKCNIYGTVDFIFGNAAAVFQNCSILAPLTSMALVCYDGGDRNVPWSFDRTQRMAGFEYNKPGQLDRVSCDIRYWGSPSVYITQLHRRCFLAPLC